MKKLSLILLKLLKENQVETSLSALSVSQVLALVLGNQHKSRSTIYRHLCKLRNLGYVKCGLDDGIGSTYFISEAGKAFLQNAN